MKVRIAYTVDVTERLRRAINHHFGRPGLASALDVRAWFTERGDSCTADILYELNQAGASVEAAVRDPRLADECPDDCTNYDSGTCPRCFRETGLGCDHGGPCIQCREYDAEEASR